jgi:pullulanase
MSACSGEDTPADGGTPTDTGVVTDAGVPDSGETPLPFGLHYHRPDGDYAGWTLNIQGTGITQGTVAAQEEDGFGAFYPLPEGVGQVTFSFDKAGAADPTGEITVDATGGEGLWVFSGLAQGFLQAPGAVPGEDQVVVYYLRDDDEYAGWGLHLWGDVAQETLWSFPHPADGQDPRWGAYYIVDMAAGGDRLNLIVHKGDEKDPGPDMGYNLSELGNIVFVITGSPEIYSVPQEIPEFAIDGAQAHFIDRETIAWRYPEGATQFELRYSLTAEIEVEEVDVVGGETLALTAGALTQPQKDAFPALRNYAALKVAAADLAAVKDALRGQLVVVARDAAGVALGATRVQLPGVLDDLYAYEGPLGATFDGGRAPTLHLWAPTAQEVKLVRFDANLSEVETLPMTRDELGVWTSSGAASWYGTYYQYEVKVYHPVTNKVETTRVTDPYAVSLSMNSKHTQLIDLANDTDFMPAGWDLTAKPALEAPEDIVIYESHIRDFSIFDQSVPAEHRGKYLAFTHNGVGQASTSAGMAHLIALQQAGLTHLHILPAFDIATVNEDASRQFNLDGGFDALCDLNPEVPAELCTQYGSMKLVDILAAMDPTSGDAQELMAWVRPLDGFNWGYDPFHYTVPEGGYATNPAGPARILEFRRMVQALAEVGLRVVLDVVYNHTNAAGLSDTSVLDKVVPGYYHRLNLESGFIENSTCCQNTATEHRMMERLMIDSLVTWARAYKIDAFRFDLMGHHMKSNMVKARDAVQALTLADDGVEGQAIYLYGEGWDFGEVQNGARGVNATQANMDGTGIGTFNDRLRDGARGGGPFDGTDALRTNQGFINGLVYDPNDLPLTGDEATQELLNSADLVRLGMAGNLERFKMVDGTGAVNAGSFISYNGARAGYTRDPQEDINYVCKHDNQTLWDINAYKMPTGTPAAQRVRAQNIGVDIVMLGQGVPFFHMGVDLLRSKSMERDSYDSGDWFNRVDFTGQDNNWNVGLPRQDKDGDNWRVILPRLADPTLQVAPADIAAASTHFREMLRIRKSTPLFRLRTEAEVMTRLDFHNVGPSQVPGLIVMSISDGTCAGADLDPQLDGVVVLVNANDEAQTFALPGAAGYALHAVQQASADAVVRGASFDGGNATFSVPGRTTAVFVQAQGGTQGAGPACNTR